MPLFRLAAPLLHLAFPSLAVGFLAGVAWSQRRRAAPSRKVAVEPRAERTVIDVPWTEE